MHQLRNTNELKIFRKTARKAKTPVSKSRSTKAVEHLNIPEE
jgi:hypothetical protein